MASPRVGVVGATGAVGTVTLALLAERGFDSVRVLASARSAGTRVRFGDRQLLVEEATPDALSAGDLDLCFFSVGTATSRELVPHAVRGGALVIDKSDAYRLTPGIPLVVAGVNDDAVGDGDRIVANPNCSAMQLTCALKPLHASCMRVPVLVGHAQAVWVETVEPLSPEEARAALAAAPHVTLADAPTPGQVAGTDEVHVGRVRRDPTAENVLALLVVNDNLRKGAALNAVQIAESLLSRNLIPV